MEAVRQPCAFEDGYDGWERGVDGRVGVDGVGKMSWKKIAQLISRLTLNHALDTWMTQQSRPLLPPIPPTESHMGEDRDHVARLR